MDADGNPFWRFYTLWAESGLSHGAACCRSARGAFRRHRQQNSRRSCSGPINPSSYNLYWRRRIGRAGVEQPTQ